MTQEVTIKIGESHWIRIGQDGNDLTLSQSHDSNAWETFAWIWWVNGWAIIGSVEHGVYVSPPKAAAF